MKTLKTKSILKKVLAYGLMSVTLMLIYFVILKSKSGSQFPVSHFCAESEGFENKTQSALESIEWRYSMAHYFKCR